MSYLLNGGLYLTATTCPSNTAVDMFSSRGALAPSR